MKRLITALVAMSAIAALATPASAYTGPAEKPTIQAPNGTHPFTIFTVRRPNHGGGVTPANGWQLTLYSGGVELGQVSTAVPAGVPQTIAIKTPATPSCHYYAVVNTWNPNRANHWRLFSSAVMGFPVSDCAV